MDLKAGLDGIKCYNVLFLRIRHASVQYDYLPDIHSQDVQYKDDTNLHATRPKAGAYGLCLCRAMLRTGWIYVRTFLTNKSIA